MTSCMLAMVGWQRVKVVTRTMASGVQDITCVFVEKWLGVLKKTLILQCPGMVCSPPVVSKCLGEAHRRLELFTLHYIRLLFFFVIKIFFKKSFLTLIGYHPSLISTICS